MSKFREMYRLLFVTLVLAVVCAEDKDMAVGMSMVKILGKSGEIQFRRQLGDASTRTDAVKIKLAKVVQMTSANAEVKKDSLTWTDMAEGYPKLDSQNKYVIVRFPRFDTKLVYDPTVSAAAAGATGQEFEDMTMGMSKVKILSDSGEIEFRRQLGDASKLTDPVKIKIAQVIQIAADGSEASTCSPLPSFKNPMKRFTGFAGKAFKIATMRKSAAMPNAGSLKAAMTKFSANLGADVGQLAIDLALAEEAGEVIIAGEKQPLKKGDMKFNMELSEWNWCGTAGASGAAAFLDVYIEVKSKKTPTLLRNNSAAAPAFELGDNMTMSFSRKFKKDSADWADMADGYPKVDPTDATRFIVRFPRFANNITYDPTVASDDNGGSSNGNAASALKVSVVVTALAAMVAYCCRCTEDV